MTKLVIMIDILMLIGYHSSHIIDHCHYKVDTRYLTVGKNDRINSIVLHYTTINALTQQKIRDYYIFLKNSKQPVINQLFYNLSPQSNKLDTLGQVVISAIVQT